MNIFKDRKFINENETKISDLTNCTFQEKTKNNDMEEKNIIY